MIHYIYNLYGINVRLPFQLSLLDNVSSKKIDVDFITNNYISIPKSFPTDRSYYDASLKKVRIHYPDVLYCEILKNGKEINFKFLKNGNSNISLIQSRVINHILPYALYQRREIVLHASGIIDNNEAILFIGKSGFGKSSLSASFKSNKFISEDAIMIKKNKKEYIAYPSSPYLKLDPKIVENLELDYLKKLHLKDDRLDRSMYRLSNFCQKPTPVKTCYILNWGKDFQISDLSVKEVIGELLISSFTAHPINSCEISAKDFNNFIFNFYNDIKFFRLTRSKSSLFNDNDKIIEHFQSI